jgi:hypothetical protein
LPGEKVPCAASAQQGFLFLTGRNLPSVPVGRSKSAPLPQRQDGRRWREHGLEAARDFKNTNLDFRSEYFSARRFLRPLSLRAPGKNPQADTQRLQIARVARPRR